MGNEKENGSGVKERENAPENGKAVRRDGYDGRNRLEALSSPYNLIL